MYLLQDSLVVSLDLETQLVDFAQKTVWFSGHVQGVGFRATTRSIAARFRVAGYVKNLPDRRVEAVFEGELGEVDGVIEAVRERMDGFISDVVIDKSDSIAGYESFEIRY